MKPLEKRKQSAKPQTTVKKTTAAKSTDLSLITITNKKVRKFSTIIGEEQSLNYESGTEQDATFKKKKGSSIFNSDETQSISPKSKGMFKSVRGTVQQVDTKSLLSRTQDTIALTKQK